MADLFDQVAAGKLAPVYVIASQQPLLVERAIAAIRDAAVPPAARGFNYDVLEGKGVTASQVLSMAQTLPMMAARRMIYIRDLAPIPAAELTKLIPYVADPNPSTVLVAAWSKLDKRTNFYKAVKKRKAVYELEPPRQVAGWIKTEAAAHGARIRPDAVSRLADVVGKDLARLSLSLDQLALYAGDRAIETDDVDDLIADTRERTVFELTDAIGARDLRAALTAVASLCDQRQSAVGVVIMLARFMRQMSQCQAAIASRMPKGQIASLVGVPPFAVDRLRAQANRYSPVEVAAGLIAVSEADCALKGMSDATKTLGRQLAERVMLDRLVTGIIER